MKIHKTIGKLLGIFAVMASVFAAAPAFAAEATPDYRIQISPVRFELKLKPGDTYEEKFQVQNTGTKAFKYKVSVSPYSVKDDKYEANFSDESAYTDLAKWITFSEDSGTVEPSSVAEITAYIKVPRDVPGGGQYAAILAQIDDESGSSEGSNVTITRQVGLIVYSEVEGNTRQTGVISENSIPTFLFQPPISATSVVKNTGNTHVTARYTLEVYPFFGGDAVYTNEDDPDTHLILPETERLNTLTWDGSPSLGLFKVKQTVEAFGETSVTEKVVFICPIWFLFIVILVVLVLVFWIVSRVRGGNKE